MSDEKKEGGLATALPMTAVLAILTSLFLSSSLPYQDERPSSRPLQIHYTAAQDVEARLWQDPFAAVDGNENAGKNIKSATLESHNSACDINTHGKERIYCGQVTDNKDISILAVTLSGGSYQEASEQRMRRRYAVLSALINQDFSPQDEQHIGYFEPDSGESLQKKVPFEWWSLPTKNKEHERKLLLLWVDESGLLECPATKLQKLLFEANPSPEITPPYAPPNSINYAVIGPNTSTILRDMLKEVEGKMPVANDDICNDVAIDKGISGKINRQDIVYFSAGATVSDNKLLNELQTKETKTLTDYFRSKNVKLYRTTATDNDMMISLMEELKLRHVDKDDTVVILSERDTFYGRAMPEAFNEKWNDLWNKKGKNKKVHIYGYMRGLDGKLPDKVDKTGSSVEKKSDSKDKSGVDTSIELPEGQNQKDYLRRMAANIFALDQSLKNSEDKNGSQKGIAAFGILGSDVHDKLMILEALRQYFPHRLFFTTDLDAIYSHPAKLPQTHNLLVVSPFDLILRRELQDKIPPFRDSYQTAFFLATQVVLHEKSIIYDWDKVKPLPRLFEIGRSHPVPLRIPDDSSSEISDKCSWTNWMACENNVQPRIIITSLLDGSLDNLVIVVLLVITIPPLVSWKVRKYGGYWTIFVVCLVVLVYLTNSWWTDYIKYFGAEPFYWHEGVSIWPSQLLRLSALLFALLFWYWSYKEIENMQKAFQEVSFSDRRKSVFALPVHADVVDKWRSLFVGSWKETRGLQVNPDDLWKTYLGYCHQKLCFFPVSMLRVLGHVVAFVCVVWLLVSLSGLPNVPARGNFVLDINKDIIFWTSLAIIFLITWVVENARLCERLIAHLSARPSQWNSLSKDWAVHENKVAPECVDDWLDIQLVAKLTETMQKLIWGPMVCIGLLVMARSPVIDDWDVPWGLWIVFITMLFYAISAEIYLQRGAKCARVKAIAQLSRRIREQRNQSIPNEAIIKRIEVEIERISMLREGAFRAWYEWPLLQSFGGLGTLVFMLQYFAGVWGNGIF